MLTNWVHFIYSTFILPPGILIVILIWLCFKNYRGNRNDRLILIGITVILYLSSISLGSDALIHSLENRYKPPAQIKGDVIIMLGGGATLETPNVDSQGHLSGAAANRLLTCIQLYHQLKAPIIVSGGKVYPTTGIEAEIARKILLGVGIPSLKIIVENKSMNTTENVKYTKKILAQYHFRQPLLVTSAFHMPRSVKRFRKAGIRVTPYPTDYRVNISNRFEIRKLVPSAEALNQTSVALKEYLGLMASRWY